MTASALCPLRPHAFPSTSRFTRKSLTLCLLAFKNIRTSRWTLQPAALVFFPFPVKYHLTPSLLVVTFV